MQKRQRSSIGLYFAERVEGPVVVRMLGEGGGLLNELFSSLLL